MSGNEREKPFVCVEVDLPDHPRIERLKDPAGSLGLWLAMLCYSRLHLTDGRVPKPYALRRWGDRRNTMRLSDMVAVGLIGEDADDYIILRYAPRNQTRKMVEEAKAKARKKMADWRDAQRRKGPSILEKLTNIVKPPSSVTGNESGNEPSNEPHSRDIPLSLPLDLSEGAPERGRRPTPLPPAPTPALLPPAREVHNATDDGAFGMAVAAWADGVGLVLGTRYLPPHGGALRRLVEAFDTYCPEGEDRVEWARKSGADYARARKGLDLNPFKFADWLGSGRPERPTEVRRIAPEGPAPIPPPRMSREDRERRERDRLEAERARREGWEPKMPDALRTLLMGKTEKPPEES